MKNIFRLLILAILISNSAAFAHIKENKYFNQEEDSSKASMDGPYVFYKGDSIVVSSIVMTGSGLAVNEDVFFDKSNTKLTCSIDDRNLFHFELMEDHEIQPTLYPLPGKILAISDIEGNFPAFRLILEGSGVIDKNYDWTFGNGHLVLVGDFFDRGLNVTETLWLIYKLEQEAESAGGKVHFILGNHEIMNLYNDTRYVRNKYIENAVLLNEPYINLFNENTELGRWLRTKNVIEKIGDIIFVHGGISTDLAVSGLSLEEINQKVRENIGKRTDSSDTETVRLANSSKTGPYWYRGLIKEEINQQEMDQILKYAEAKQIVVGHSLVEEISTFYQNSVIGIDLDHAENIKQNKMHALWIENGVFYVIDNNGVKIKLM